MVAMGDWKILEEHHIIIVFNIGTRGLLRVVVIVFI